THAKQVFFDPTRFRPDRATGEALLAHELTHTQQAADRAPQAKEAEAMVREAAYLDWLQPGGAPVVVEELPLDPTTPEAAAAGDVAESGVLRARAGRTTQAAESGPRLDEAKKEERVAQILDSVQTAINGAARWEADRIGRLADRLNRS
ncbi:MAG: DUF4157 domain-containing protein, partial [Myxococcales bacterium]|nr:DUF4157 domain-containing protein [Myxococcales bacterium]